MPPETEETLFSIKENSNVFRATLLLRLIAVVFVLITAPLRSNLPQWMGELFYTISYPLFFYNLLFIIFYKKTFLFLNKNTLILFFDLFIAIGILQIGGGWRNSYFVYTLTSIILFTIFSGRKGAHFSSIILAISALIKDPAANLPSLEIFDVTNWDMRVGAALFYLAAGLILGYFSVLLKKLEMFSKAQIKETRKRAAIEEKVRLSLELHDGAKQMVLAMTLMLKSLVKRTRHSYDEMNEDLEKLSKWLNELQKELNRIVESLKMETQAISPCNLVTLAKDEAKNAEEMTGFCWFVSSKSPVISVPNTCQETIKNFFKESLMNSWKHSGQSSGKIELICSGQKIIITISDKGKGFSYSPDKHKETTGLRSLKYRAEELNGQLTLETSPGKGCKVILIFPFTEF